MVTLQSNYYSLIKSTVRMDETEKKWETEREREKGREKEREKERKRERERESGETATGM